MAKEMETKYNQRCELTWECTLLTEQIRNILPVSEDRETHGHVFILGTDASKTRLEKEENEKLIDEVKAIKTDLNSKLDNMMLNSGLNATTAQENHHTLEQKIIDLIALIKQDKSDKKEQPEPKAEEAVDREIPDDEKI